MRLPQDFASQRSNAVIENVVASFEAQLPISEFREQLTCMDGLLTAAAIGPYRTKPHDWMRALYGSAMPDDGEEYLKPLMTLWSIRHNGILDSIRRDKRDYRPDFLRTEPEDRHFECAEVWSEGFFAGMRLHGERWLELIRDKNRRTIITSIAAFKKSADGKSAISERVPISELDETLALLFSSFGEDIYETYLYWRERSGEARRQPQRLGKVGRNETCPCGSGAKYKRCCAE